MTDFPPRMDAPVPPPSAATGADAVPPSEAPDEGLEQFYTTEYVAHLFSVATETVVQWINDRKLRAIKIDRRWRVPKSAIIEFANQRLNS